MIYINESLRRTLASVAQWGGWIASLVVYGWSILGYQGFAPHWVGFTLILCIGIAIGGTTARARMRLSDTIVQAFRAGMDSVKREVVQKIDEG